MYNKVIDHKRNDSLIGTYKDMRVVKIACDNTLDLGNTKGVGGTLKPNTSNRCVRLILFCQHFVYATEYVGIIPLVSLSLKNFH